MVSISEQDVLEIQTSLLDWFREAGRKFPWRETRDPYAVLLAEKLLQQTSVRESTILVYELLLAKYPTLADLTRADPNELREVIKSLGLHYRSQELVRMAKELDEKHRGAIPNNLKELVSTYGIGDYSARAILSFAFGQDAPVVDTNIARILFRLFGLPGKMPANPARNRGLMDLMGTLIPAGHSREFNLAMIDLGSMVCKSSTPLCDVCPLQHICVGRL